MATVELALELIPAVAATTTLAVAPTTLAVAAALPTTAMAPAVLTIALPLAVVVVVVIAATTRHRVRRMGPASPVWPINHSSNKWPLRPTLT